MQNSNYVCTNFMCVCVCVCIYIYIILESQINSGLKQKKIVKIPTKFSQLNSN